MLPRTPRPYLIGTGLLLVAGALLYAGFTFRVYTLPTGGMFPAYTTGSRVVARLRPYRDIGEVARGDIVVFRHTGRDREHTYIWRVVGLPGDLLELQGNEIRVNEQPLVYQTLRTDGTYSIVRETNGGAAYEISFDREAGRISLGSARIYLQADELFLMGDNRLHARDSRFIGPVKFAAITARVLWTGETGKIRDR